MILQSLLVIMGLLAAQGETTFTVEYNSTRYEYHITDQDLQATPAWQANQDNPPLSARSAIDIASKEIAALLPNGKDWRLYEVTLLPSRIGGFISCSFSNRYEATVVASSCPAGSKLWC